MSKIDIKEIVDKINKFLIFDENLKGWQINKYGEIISKEEINQLMEYIGKLRNILFNHIEYDNDSKKQINFFGYSDKEDDEFEILKELV